MTSAERSRQAAAWIWTSLIVVTVLLLSRRVAGGIDGATSAWPCLLISSLVTLLSGVGWLAFQQQPSARATRVEQLVAVVAWLPTWLSGVALLPADSAFARGWLFGIAALFGAGIISSLQARPQRLPETAASTVPQAPLVGEVDHPVSDAAAVAVTPSDLAVFTPVTDERSDEATTQWMTRQALAEGGDQIEGAIRIAFAVGQRAASVHIPFSPPFAAVPQVECELDGGEPARWKVSVVYAYGMRVELKRESSDESAEIELSYSAVCESAASEAA